jgi:hypothetical protein
MAGGLVHLWEQSGIQILVLLSFTFQVFLLVFAGIRRRKAPALMRLLIWLVYLLADSTAIYALGHLSLTSRSREHGLMAFWAPFLLVHLGGPDTISAYALEDNRLWLRHMLTLVVQVTGVAYVIFIYTADSGTRVLLAAILMFITGVLKYAERIWALRCGNMSSIRSTVQHSVDSITVAGRRCRDILTPYSPGQEVKDMGDEEFLLHAHYIFFGCRCIFVDVSGYRDSDCEIFPHRYDRKTDVHKVVEMELSLMYDILYTKAGVIHTRYGYCIRVVSLLATITSVGLFQSSNIYGYSRADVAITYILLVGALVLEMISISKAIASTWTCAWLLRMKWKPVLKGLKFLRQHVQAARKRRLSSCIGQYNMLHLCTRDTDELGSRLALKMGIEDWWNRYYFVGSIDILKTHLWELLLETLHKLNAIDSRGIHILERRGLLHGKWCRWSMNIDFDQSILIWHIATDIYLCESRYTHDYDSMDCPAGKLAEAVKVLSNYMLFLLVAKPDLVPGPIRPTKYVHTGVLLGNNILYGEDYEVSIWPITWDMVKKLFHKDGPNGSSSCRVEERKKFARAIRNTFSKEEVHLYMWFERNSTQNHGAQHVRNFIDS